VASLRAELAESQAALARAAEELARARERIAELEARLRQTPRNSSRPPSSEGLDKPPPRRSLRKKSGRKPGGQDGHEGSTLAQVARPDRELRHEPGWCGRCGAGLAGQPVTGVERRQVFDLPEVAVAVTQHQLIERECRCGQRTRATAPAGADGPVQYGPRIAAIIVYLYLGRFLSKQRTAQALAELFGIPFVIGHRRHGHRPCCRTARQLLGSGAGQHRHGRGGRARRDRVPGRWSPALGALRPHRQVHLVHGRPRRAGRSDPPVPLRGPGRGQPDRCPLRAADEKAPRAGPPPGRPPG
jgi:transposase